MRYLLLGSVWILFAVRPACARAQQNASTIQATGRTVVAVPFEAEDTIVLDGQLDEPIWQRATPATDFLQLDPDNGAPATERTDVRIAFDRQRLYIGHLL